MWTLIPVLLAINIPLGYFVCRRYEIHTYGKIFSVGLAQYVVSALGVATLLVFTDQGIQGEQRLLAALYLGFAGVLAFAVFIIPIILLYAYILYRQFRKV